MGHRPYLWWAAWGAFSVILGVLYVNLPLYNLDGVPEVVAYVRDHTTPQETVWAFADNVLDIHHLACRKPPCRFWHPYFILAHGLRLVAASPPSCLIGSFASTCGGTGSSQTPI